MRQIATTGIVLARTDYGEADRILSILTPDHGKLQCIAKGVRKSRSKLAGGIELLSVSELTLIQGKSELKTLVSARLKRHFGNITKDLPRTSAAYDMISTIHKRTDDNAEPEYFRILNKALIAINSSSYDISKTQLWFYAHLLWFEGHTPNLAFDAVGNQLRPDCVYQFDFGAMAFTQEANGVFTASHIKLLRIAIGKEPKLLQQVTVHDDVIAQTLQLLKNIILYNKT